MQLHGDFSKVSLPSLLQLARNGELTGKFALKQGDRTAGIYIEHGRLLHAESESQVGRDALLELFLWTNGSFSFAEGPLADVPGTFLPDEPLDKVLREGFEYVEQKKYLDKLGITGKTVLNPHADVADDAECEPLLSLLDGRKTIAQALAGSKLSRRIYIQSLYKIINEGLAEIIVGQGMPPSVVADDIAHAPIAAIAAGDNKLGSDIDLPGWVVARLLQENPDLSKAIVDLVVWADRVKCWLYQADEELAGVIEKLERAGNAEGNEKDAPVLDEQKSKQRVSKLSELISQTADAGDDEAQVQEKALPEERSKPRTMSRPPSVSKPPSIEF